MNPSIAETPKTDALHLRLCVCTDPLTVATEEYKKLERENIELRAKLEAQERDQLARNLIDPVTRLHNLCDGIAEHRRESPYTADQIDVLDAENKELRTKLKAAEASLRERQKDAERYEIAAADERKLREDAEKMLPWWRDRFDDLVDDAETLLGYAPKDCHAALLGMKEVAAQSRNSITAALGNRNPNDAVQTFTPS